MYFSKKITFLIILILFLFNNCTSLPGINKSPKKTNPNKKIKANEYSIEDVKINIIKINNLSDEKINQYNKNQEPAMILKTLKRKKIQCICNGTDEKKF